MAREPSLLDQIAIDAPCSESWEGMRGAHGRLCGTCERVVHDLESLSRAEAEALLAQHRGGTLCVRMRRRDDGAVVTRDPPKRRLVVLAVLAAACGPASADPPAEPAPPLAASAQSAPTAAPDAPAMSSPALTAEVAATSEPTPPSAAASTPRPHGGAAKPGKASGKEASGHTIGCVCVPGDRLCPCL